MKEIKEMTWKEFIIEFMKGLSFAMNRPYWVIGWTLVGLTFLLCFFKPDIPITKYPPSWAIIGAFSGFIGFIILWLRESYLRIFEKKPHPEVTKDE